SYGLGADIIASALLEENCKVFFVASIDEGMRLRKTLGNSSNIFVLNGVFYNDAEELKQHELIPVLNNLKQIEIWQEFALSKKQKMPCILHFDTGMNRLGIAGKTIEQIINNQDLLSGLELKYIMSHLSASEELDNPCNFEQLARFKQYLQYF